MSNCPTPQSLEAFYNGLIDSEIEIDAICDHLEHCPTCQANLDGFSPSEYEQNFRKVIMQSEELGQELQDLFDEQLENADELSVAITNSVGPPSGVGQSKKERFEKFRKVGQGHFFKCVKAFDPWQQTDVAVKIARAGSLSSRDHQNQFCHDCYLYSFLSQENIPPILDFGMWDEKHWFISTQWIDATPLDHWLNQSQAAFEVAMRVVLQVCRAVQHAHDNQIIHRHLDFSNVLVTEDNHAWVTDFGFVLDKRYQFDLAEDKKAVSASLPREFSTPENSKWVDERSDVFSIGKILEHCTSLSNQVDPAIAVAMQPIISKCSVRSRGKRYQSVLELSDAIAKSHPSLAFFNR